MSSTDLQPNVTESLLRAIARNVRSNWSDVPPKTKVFAIEYSKAGNVEKARKKVGISKKQAEELLDNDLVKAYIDFIIAEDAEVSAITRDFLQVQMIETLGQVNGDVEVPFYTKDGAVEARQFNAQAKISLLKEMRMFLDVSSPDQSDKISFLSRLDPSKEREFETPEELWAGCIEYFEWVESNPLFSVQVVHQAGKAQEIRTPCPRVPTRKSLCVFLGIRTSTWDGWSKDPDSPFFGVVEAAGGYIDEAKLAGGVAGIMNPNLIARDLGLTDAHSHRISGYNGGPLTMISKDMSAQEAADAYSDTLGADKEG